MNQEKQTCADLKDAWYKLLMQSGSLADSRGVFVTIPTSAFDQFNREFNLCFVKEEDDVEFQSWKDSLKEDG